MGFRSLSALSGLSLAVLGTLPRLRHYASGMKDFSTVIFMNAANLIVE